MYTSIIIGVLILIIAILIYLQFKDKNTHLENQFEEKVDLKETEPTEEPRESTEDFQEKIQKTVIVPKRVQTEQDIREAEETEKIKNQKNEMKKLKEKRLEERKFEEEKFEEQKLKKRELEKQKFEKIRAEQRKFDNLKQEEQKVDLQGIEEEKLKKRALEKQKNEELRAEQRRLNNIKLEEQIRERERSEKKKLEAQRVEEERVKAKKIELQRAELQRVEAQKIKERTLRDEEVKLKAKAEVVTEKINLPECAYPKFDYSRLIEMGLEANEAAEYVQELIPQIKIQIPLIKEAIEASDYHALEQLTHSIKGSSTTVGTGGVADLLIDFNTYVKSGKETPILEEYLKYLIHYCNELEKEYA